MSQRFDKKTYDLDIMVEELDAVIEHYRTSPAQRVFLLGHSWGAILASQYINTYPERVDGAILCEPGGLTYAQIKDYLGRSQKYGTFSEALNDAVYFDQFLTGGENLFDDFKVRLGGQVEVLRWNGLAFTAKAYCPIHRFENTKASMFSFGSEFSGGLGFYKRKWYVAGEFGFDKATPKSELEIKFNRNRKIFLFFDADGKLVNSRPAKGFLSRNNLCGSPQYNSKKR